MNQHLKYLSDIANAFKEKIFNISKDNIDLDNDKILLLLCQNLLYSSLQCKIDYSIEDYGLPSEEIFKNKSELLLTSLLILKIYDYDFSNYFNDSQKDFDDDQIYVISETINSYIIGNKKILGSQSKYFLISIIKDTYSKNLYKKIIKNAKELS